MAINAQVLNWQPVGLSDAVDGTNAFKGAMQSLQNLVPDPTTTGVFVCRPAAVDLITFSGFNAPGFVSAMFVNGDMLYGLVASNRNPGHDEPFVYNLSTMAFLTVGNITAANTPTSPPTTGHWQPPILDQIGGRVVACHPGFPGGATKFGWFDVSGFSTITTGNLGYPAIASTNITGNPNIFGIQPGMTVTGAGVSTNTHVISASAIEEQGTVSTTAGSANLVSSGPLPSNMVVGWVVTGVGIPDGATITALSGLTITISAAATATGTPLVTFTGAEIVTDQMQAAATGVSLTIAGGTPTSPLWGAGDTSPNNLASQPLAVAQMNGRAWYACGPDGVRYSDSGFACQITDAPNVQALVPGNRLPVTCFGKLQIGTVTIGIVQGLVVFQRDSAMLQITGDQALGNLAMNALPVATGTHAPLSVVSTAQGVAFISPTGLRMVTMLGQVTEPIGEQGAGVTAPFQFINNPPMGGAADPSRICAATNGNSVRISVPTIAGPSFEYWYDLARKSWSGPHTCPASLIQAWTATYVMTPVGITGLIRRSDDIPTPQTQYTENGVQLGWEASPVLLPDNAVGRENAMIEATIAIALADPKVVLVQFVDEQATVIDLVQVNGTTPPAGWGGGFTWSGMPSGVPGPQIQQHGLHFHQPIVFKQGRIILCGASGADVKVGNFYLKIGPLSYQLQEAASCDLFPLSVPNGGTGNSSLTACSVLVGNGTQPIISSTFLHACGPDLIVDSGIEIGAPAGGYMGPGTLNLSGDYYLNGVPLEGGNRVHIGPSPPSTTGVRVGDLWWDDVAGQLYILYDDGTSVQWVSVVNQSGSGGAGLGLGLFVLKQGDTMTGDLTVPNVHLSGSYLYFGGSSGTVNGSGGPLIYGDSANIVIKNGGSQNVMFQNASGADTLISDASGNLTATGYLITSAGGDPGSSTTRAALGFGFWRFAVSSGDDSAAGTITYRYYDSNALGIVGAGVYPNRKVTLWDNVQINGTLSAPNANISGTVTAGTVVANSSTIYGTLTVNYISSPSLAIGGTINGSSLSVSGDVNAGGSVYANNGPVYTKGPQSALIAYDRNDGTQWCGIYYQGLELNFFYSYIGTSAFSFDYNGQLWLRQRAYIFPATHGNGYCGLAGNAFAGMESFNYYNASGRERKTGIKPVPDGALALVNKIRPQTYSFVDVPSPQPHWGFIAEDVGEVMRQAGLEFAGYRVDEGNHRLAYNELIAVLWKAVQELAAKVTDGPRPE